MESFKEKTCKIPTPPCRPLPIQFSINKEFKKIFQYEIPSHESILHVYTCAWNKEVLIQGRMYITDHHVAFKGWNQSVMIDFTQVISIEKKSLALVIPNAIEIQTIYQKYFFASFFNRDEAFDILQQIWTRHVPKESLLRKYPILGNLDCVCTNPQLQSCDVCLARKRLTVKQEFESMKSKSNLTNLFLKAQDHMTWDGEVVSISKSFTRRKTTPSPDQVSPKSKIKTSVIASHVRSHSDSICMKSVFEPKSCSCTPLEGEAVILDMTLPVDISTCFHQIHLTNEKHYGWYLQFCQLKDIKEIKIGPWVPKEQESVVVELESFHQRITMKHLKVGYHRKIQYAMPLNAAIGPKTTICYIEQTVENVCSGAFLCIVEKTETPLVPAGNTFYSQGRFCMTQLSKDSTRLLKTFRVVFTKTNLLKGAYIKGATSSTQAFHAAFQVFIKKQLDMPMSPKENEQLTISETRKISFSLQNCAWTIFAFMSIIQIILLMQLLHEIKELKILHQSES